MNIDHGMRPDPALQLAVTGDGRRAFLTRLWDQLWDAYRRRVPYARDYEQLIAQHGATFVNDHVAFRTLASNSPQVGISCVSRIFESLGYTPAGCYNFPDKHLTAIHYQPAWPGLPKVFISELRVWELSSACRAIVQATIASHRKPLHLDTLATLATLDHSGSTGASPTDAGLLQQVVDHFQQLPWHIPEKDALQAVHEESQYAAWVLVHGYQVNHFTALINAHGVPALESIEATVAALRGAGVPMKLEIEGAAGSKLRQTATEAVSVEVDVRDASGQLTRIPWNYAYFELAERGMVLDPAQGAPLRFEGFLGPQASQLFEMTGRGPAARSGH